MHIDTGWVGAGSIAELEAKVGAPGGTLTRRTPRNSKACVCVCARQQRRLIRFKARVRSDIRTRRVGRTRDARSKRRPGSDRLPGETHEDDPPPAGFAIVLEEGGDDPSRAALVAFVAQSCVRNPSVFLILVVRKPFIGLAAFRKGLSLFGRRARDSRKLIIGS